MDMESLELNPATSKQLSCPTSQKLKNGSTLQYTWTKDGVDITEDNTVEFLVISADQTLNETLVEMYECSVSVIGDAKFGKLHYVYSTHSSVLSSIFEGLFFLANSSLSTWFDSKPLVLI